MYRIPVRNLKRNYLALTVQGARGDSSAEQMLERQLKNLEGQYGAEIVEDYRYELEAGDIFDPTAFLDAWQAQASLDDVLNKVRAIEAWELARGRGVAIAVVDTGIDGRRPEFGMPRRVGAWAPEGQDAWADYQGHGTMRACIAAAARAEGGEFDGIAPDSYLISCRTSFYETELTAIYDYLTTTAKKGLKIVATNSFGPKSGGPPPTPPDNDFTSAMTDAIAAGVMVFFSAGNNHQLAGGEPSNCSPNSIWLHKSRADATVVSTCQLTCEMWYHASRGSGQFCGEQGTSRKPDVMAPTPWNGRVLYGDAVHVLPDGWGTSGASPQAAGFAALLLSRNSSLSREFLFQTLRNSAVSLRSSPNLPR